MPNLIAYGVLLGWPVVAYLLFTRTSRAAAVIWTILVAHMVLPSNMEVDFPLLPAFDRDTVPAMAALALCLLGFGLVRKGRGKVEGAESERPGWLPQSWLLRLLLFVMVLSPLVTGYLNSDPLAYGSADWGFRRLKGMELYDGLSLTLSQAMLLLPLLLGRRLLGDPKALRLLLWCMVVIGLVYTLPILFELRMSPQLHTWIYGYYPHESWQNARFGGWRPQVFFQHGLRLAVTMSVIVVAAMMIPRLMPAARKMVWRLGAAWLTTIFVLSKSTGAILFAAAAAPFAMFATKRLQILVAAAVSLLVFIYPAARGIDLVPTERLVSFAETISAARAESLSFRFKNEDLLLEKAADRSVFGWGSFGRGRVYDDATGRDLAITDGMWIIIFGSRGWAGYLATFGLLTLPALMLMRRWRSEHLALEGTAVALALSLNLLDLLLNSGLTSMTWLLAGALIGHAEWIAEKDAKGKKGMPEPGAQRRRRGRPERVGPVQTPPEAEPEPAPAPVPAYARAPAEPPGPRRRPAPEPLSRPSRPRRGAEGAPTAVETAASAPSQEGPTRPGLGGRPQRNGSRQFTTPDPFAEPKPRGKR
ncbi:hypothetical protein P2H44_03575 [Albimonas sp. CAU 1670]|uniref:hypothetical protein n=1 Tax=Albimonas sp. CAU 1670 TaxID=3032599 RepID=UPI0023DA52EA|nr:hypothetical protein [Albimonas sp. CAU 1670]MDF2231625.1 hypothetical protein [Albimonas sp. CAU 1670]